MQTRRINADNGAAPVGAYAQGYEVSGTSRRLYISGQAPVTPDGAVPATFKAQAETVWRNILAQLYAADMTASNIVHATTFLTDRAHRDENREVRMDMLNGHICAMTVVLAEMFEDGWLLEINAIAEA